MRPGTPRSIRCDLVERQVSEDRPTLVDNFQVRPVSLLRTNRRPRAASLSRRSRAASSRSLVRVDSWMILPWLSRYRIPYCPKTRSGHKLLSRWQLRPSFRLGEIGDLGPSDGILTPNVAPSHPPAIRCHRPRRLAQPTARGRHRLSPRRKPSPAPADRQQTPTAQ